MAIVRRQSNWPKLLFEKGSMYSLVDFARGDDIDGAKFIVRYFIKDDLGRNVEAYKII